jgi:hypothetical protein
MIVFLQAAPAEMSWVITLIERVGVPIGLLLFFVWWAWQAQKSLREELRETRNRLTSLEGWIRETLVEKLDKNTDALMRVCKSVDKLEKNAA